MRILTFFLCFYHFVIHTVPGHDVQGAGGAGSAGAGAGAGAGGADSEGDFEFLFI